MLNVDSEFIVTFLHCHRQQGLYDDEIEEKEEANDARKKAAAERAVAAELEAVRRAMAGLQTELEVSKVVVFLCVSYV